MLIFAFRSLSGKQKIKMSSACLASCGEYEYKSPPPFLGVVFDSGFVKIDYIYRLHVYPQKSIIHLIEFIGGEFK